MRIYVDDLHPGRCLNHRTISGVAVRCLDYENTPHVCTFPTPPAPAPMASYTVSVHAKKVPWVKPSVKGGPS